MSPVSSGLNLKLIMKTKFVMHEGIAEMLKDLSEMYDKGEIEGMVVLVNMSNKKDIWYSWSNMSSIERFGILEYLKQLMIDKIRKE